MPDDMPRPSRRERRKERGPRPNRVRWIVGILIGVLVVLALSLRAIATFWTDYLWFDSLDLTAVWRRLLSARLTLGIGATLVFFLILWINLLVADRLAPKFRPVTGPEDDVVVRYRQLVAGRQRVLSFGLALLVAVVPGLGAASQWRSWLLFRYGGSFDKADAQFGTDIGFYVFKLPFLSQVVDWLFAFLLVTVVIVAIVHYLNGAIRLQPMGERITQNAKAQISVLLAATALVKAADYVLQRYELTFTAGKSFDGAGYTAVNSRIPAIEFLILISVFVAVLFIINIWRRGWIMPGIVVSLWVLVALVVGSVYPAFVQRFQVSPAELSKERPYIERNIEATRDALGLASVEQVNFDYQKTVTQEAIDGQRVNLTDARLLDPDVIKPTIQELEFEREFYQFDDVDVDRYTVEDPESAGATSRVPAIVSARELNASGIQNPTWEKLHLVFTHGYGLALAPANTTNARGEPDFLVQGIPARTTGLPELERPEIYHGEDMAGYAIVGTDQKELSTDQVSTKYTGKSGVALDSVFRRAAFALRFGEIEPLISSNLTDKSKVIYQRDVKERVRTIAPYLTLDTDPYPVMVDGRIKYIVDAYTTADTYPYGEEIDARTIDASVNGSFNYIRNSVKAVVDAYDGTVTMYLTDTLYGGEKDPIIRAYAKAFPDLYETDIPDSLSRHFRYPELLFEVQTTLWGRYHQSDPSAFFNNSDRWSVAQQPPNSASTPITTDPTTGQATSNLDRIQPYYQMIQLTPDSQPEFVLTRPFVLASGDESGRNLTALMVASNDPGSYGKLRQIVMASDGETSGGSAPKVDGPLQANQTIVTDARVSEYQTIVGRNGSSVRYGNMLILPFRDSLLYVRPVYAKAEQSGRFALTRVAVTNGDVVGFGDTIDVAVADLLDGDADGAVEQPAEPVPPPDGGTTTTTTTPQEGGRTATQLLADADAKFAEADDRLKAGDLGGYQTAVAQARDLVRQADAALEKATSTTAPGSTASSTTTTTAPPAATGTAAGGG
ncbi:UPF0182 family membrane protein [Dermatobacter hominis]|uniref:UPF0182 family membrane protein n=1 Tax=Dermatobacter hominis TaxID=2884263 RepID=UPI001D110B23|nr:UPF0182 family protein [Dermatobacter hominis]UDY38087.1 UPF0182 family protein [Dermatobacter hominis]